MPWRCNQMHVRKRIRFITLPTIILFAAVCSQTLRGQAETGSTNSAGFTDTWQSAREGSSNAWEKVKSGSVRTWENTKEGASNAWSSVEHGTTQAWDSVTKKWESTSKTNYLYSKKDEFVSQANDELKDLDRKIRQLSDKTAGAGASAKAEAKKKLASIKGQRKYLNRKLSEAKKASEADWQAAQAGFQNAYDNTTNSVIEAWNWLKSKTD